jgi:hypothetical protein
MRVVFDGSQRLQSEIAPYHGLTMRGRARWTIVEENRYMNTFADSLSFAGPAVGQSHRMGLVPCLHTCGQHRVASQPGMPIRLSAAMAIGL